MQQHQKTKINTILNILKTSNSSLSSEKIYQLTGIEIKHDPSLLEILKKTNKVLITRRSLKGDIITTDPVNEDYQLTLAFKFLFNYRTELEFLKELKNFTLKGINIEKLKESPIDITNTLKKLQELKIISIIKDYDNSKILFLNLEIPEIENLIEKIEFGNFKIEEYKNPTELLKEDDEIKGVISMWKEIDVQDFGSVMKKLNEMEGKQKTEEKKPEQPNIKNQQNKKKKVKRRIRITNTHVKDLDLNDLD